MFDKTYVQAGPQSMDVTVHEHRAPTDESVKILRDAEERAQERLLSITRLESNEFNATWHVSRRMDNCHVEIVCRFSLNGTEHRVNISAPEEKAANEHELMDMVQDAIEKKMTNILCIDLYQKHHKVLWRRP